EACLRCPSLTGTLATYGAYPTTCSACSNAYCACGVSHSGPPGPNPTTVTSPDRVRSGVPVAGSAGGCSAFAALSSTRVVYAGLGTTATEKYGTDPASTSSSDSTRSAFQLARSTYAVSANRPDSVNAACTAG